MAKQFDELARSTEDDDVYGHLQLLSNASLAAILRDEYDVRDIVSGMLAARGHDMDDKWVGFERARAQHLQRMGRGTSDRVEAFRHASWCDTPRFTSHLKEPSGKCPTCLGPLKEMKF